MSAKRCVMIVSIAFLILLAVHMGASYGRLPDRVASHFDLSGRPNGWMDKASLLIMFVAMAVAFNALTLLLVPWLIRKTPQRWVNLPWKRYWFATPERKEQAMQRQEAVGTAAGVVTNLLLLIAWHTIYQENVLGARPRLPIGGVVYMVLGIAVVYILWALLYLRPPRTDSPR